MPNDPIPNPGSSKALDLGCTCPMIDNCYGKGFRHHGASFVVREDCPIHEWKEKENVDAE